jgi:hypothetical protein
MANCGLTNVLADVHSEQVSNTHVRGSTQINFALVSDGIRPCIKAIGLLDVSILKSYQRATFIDLDLLLLFGAAPERLERTQFRNLLHTQFEYHNIYRRVKKIYESSKENDWSLEDEHVYKTPYRDITAAMLWAVEKCSI